MTTLSDHTLPPLIGMAPLMRRAFAGEDLSPLGTALMARAQANPLDAHAWMDFSTVLQLTGNRAHALAVQAEAIAIQPLYTLPATAPEKVRLLVIMGPGDLMANTPIEFLVDQDVTLNLLYLTDSSQWPTQVPEHDVLLVGVAESQSSQSLLARLARDLTDWPRPVLNPPQSIAVLSRDGACAVLQHIDGLLMPVTTRCDRSVLLGLATGGVALTSLLPQGEFPVIVRPLGSHAGQQLDKLDDPAALAGYLGQVDAAGFYVSRFIDYRSSDGQYRKYRIVLIDGRPYICHCAISSHWMIHYLNAGMTESATKRAEEARCMASFEQDFGRRHAAAFAAIHARIGLSYLGIDCAETRDGALLIFEVDNAMVVHDMDPDALFAYKKPVMQTLFSAFRAMLERARVAC